MPIDRGAIDEQLREIGEGERWWEQREFRALPHILHPDERILGLANGRLLGTRRTGLGRTGGWLLVATSQRLICLKQERFARKQVEFAAGQVTGFRQRSRLRNFQITIETPQRRYRIRIPKDEAFRFAGALTPLLPNPQLQRLSPELEPLQWLPGITTIAGLPGVAAVVSKVSMLSPPDSHRAHDRLAHLETTVDQLRGDVERLQQQVEFLEDLLQKRADELFLPQSAGDS